MLDIRVVGSTGYVLLSYPITESMPLYGSTPPPVIKKHSSIKDGDTANTSIITFHSHTGTHLDFPGHFIEGGCSSSDYSFDDFIFDHPLIVDIPRYSGELILKEDIEPFSAELKDADLLLIRTGFNKYRKQEIYRTHNPGIHTSAIGYLRERYKNIRAVGIDSISISSFQHREEGRKAHKEAFRISSSYGTPLLLIEDLQLDGVDEMKRVIILPINIPDLDGVPCTILGEMF